MSVSTMSSMSQTRMKTRTRVKWVYLPIMSTPARDLDMYG